MNQSAPSGPVVMSPGVLRRATGYSVIDPVGVMRPTPGRTPWLVNHRLPSGPSVMSAGALATVRPVENPVMLGWFACADAGSTASAATDASAAVRRQTLRGTE